VPDIGAEFEGEAPGGEISLEAAGPIEAGPPPPPSTPRETLASKLMGDGATEARALSADASEPKVEWPDDAERTILALRLVASVDRFSGRALRQALMGEGFALGKMDIFHKAGPDGRAIISAASLTRPGTFSLETIDTQRFIGLNLFAVLPGPLSGSETLDELITTARAMNERLRGGLQDDAGQPLTPTRIATMRSTLVDTPAMPPLATEQASDSLDADTEPLQGEPEFDADAGNEPTPSPAERAPPP
jgi:FtsZ-interacting cell division protein ZipA